MTYSTLLVELEVVGEEVRDMRVELEKELGIDAVGWCVRGRLQAIEDVIEGLGKYVKVNGI